MRGFFPKLEVPYEREELNGELVVTDSTKEEYQWVFQQAQKVRAIEKIDGENMRVDFDETGTPVSIYIRDNYHYENDERVYELKEIPMWDSSLSHYTEGIINAFGKGWIDRIDTHLVTRDEVNTPGVRPDPDKTIGVHFGELVGPRVQGNRYDLDKHYWVPFGYAHKNLEVESYGQYSTDFESISEWFKGNLLPLFYSKMHGGLSFDKSSERVEVEGLVFVLGDGPVHERKMAKLRKSDFKWYHE